MRLIEFSTPLTSALTLATLCVFHTSVQAQTTDGKMQEYKRNALTTMMVFHPEDEFCKDIYAAFFEVPFPDKYDDHNIGYHLIDFNTFYGLKHRNETYAFRSQNPEELKNNQSVYEELKSEGYLLQSPDYEALGQKQENLAQGLNKAKYGKTLSKKEIEINGLAIEYLLNENQIAKQMVAKWFNMHPSDEDSTLYVFDTQLIQERGNYAATSLDVELARQTLRGLTSLSDAGEELIKHSFVLVNDITYITSEEKAQAAKIAMQIIGGVTDVLIGTRNTGKVLSSIADSFTGFNVKTHSYLYQLQWNDSIAAIFYKEYYTDTPNIEKMRAFLNDSTTFQLKYVAHEYEFSDKSALKGQYDRKDLVKLQTTRSMDKNIASLQRQWEDFKVKTPIIEQVFNEKGKLQGYAAKIGLKEGIDEKTVFKVVQEMYDPNTQRTEYKEVAKMKAVKGKIWDNRFMAAEEQENGANLGYTLLKKKSGGDILPGMLIVAYEY